MRWSKVGLTHTHTNLSNADTSKLVCHRNTHTQTRQKVHRQTSHTHTDFTRRQSLSKLHSLFSPFFHTHTHTQRSLNLSSPLSRTHAQRPQSLDPSPTWPSAPPSPSSSSASSASSAPSLSRSKLSSLSFLSAVCTESPIPTNTHAHHHTCFRNTPTSSFSLSFSSLQLGERRNPPASFLNFSG